MKPKKPPSLKIQESPEFSDISKGFEVGLEEQRDNIDAQLEESLNQLKVALEEDQAQLNADLNNDHKDEPVDEEGGLENSGREPPKMADVRHPKELVSFMSLFKTLLESVLEATELIRENGEKALKFFIELLEYRNQLKEEKILDSTTRNTQPSIGGVTSGNNHAQKLEELTEKFNDLKSQSPVQSSPKIGIAGLSPSQGQTPPPVPAATPPAAKKPQPTRTQRIRQPTNKII